ESSWNQVLVFCRTKHGANRLAEKLSKDGMAAEALHGNKSQAARTRALAGFKNGKVVVLVATDIAARGLDIDQLPYVVNFELPNVPEDYVHRIGRTGRAGSEGVALSLVDRTEMRLLKQIERLTRNTIERIVVEGWTPPSRQAIEEAGDNEETYAERRFNNAPAPRAHAPRRSGPPGTAASPGGTGAPAQGRQEGRGGGGGSGARGAPQAKAGPLRGRTAGERRAMRPPLDRTTSWH